ncbi:MAG: Hsp70 family protein [Nannocystaceae bacterium]
MTAESSPRYVVGVDLGTTHCALAWSPIARVDVSLLELPQLIAPGEVAARPLLPSFLYLPAEGELAPGDVTLPWGQATRIVGALAQQLGARVPGRLVASAKSWICHGGVNRRAPILPWSAPDEEPHVSPFEAEVAYLEHLRAAWDHVHPDAPLAEQDVVVTVPASFDEVARGLTVEIARAAGIAGVRLLEEPQAAFYDFIGARSEALAELLAGARLVLVIDVGGGTTDLTLVRVTEADEGPPQLERVAVGGHLILGGDNMDAALAHHVQEAAGIKRLDATEWSGLVAAVRRAKERLLAGDREQEVISIARRGSRLVGGAKSVPLTREDVERVLVDGFLPRTRPGEVATRAGRAGLTTLGLPYTTDPAIPRHLCAFLRQHVHAAREAGAEITDGLPRPDRVLLNGGVFNAKVMVARLAEVLEGWYGAPVPVLEHTSLDTAVARGAARFALGKRGFGPVIEGGSARAYYIGVDDPDGRRRALCVAPRGMAEGVTVKAEGRLFELLVGRPVSFPIYACAGDRHDKAGALIDIDDELDPLPPIETALRADDMSLGADQALPVQLAATLTTSGSLELYVVSATLPPRQWRLEFALTEEVARPTGDEAEVEPAPLPAEFGHARSRIDEVFGGERRPDAKAAGRLRGELERLIGPRGAWSSRLCRALGSALLAHGERRGLTVEHERAWLRLVGWCLRPGFGEAGDPERLAALWAIHGEGLKHPDDAATATEWWVMWRRVAAGLDRRQQAALYDDVRGWLSGKPPQGRKGHGLPEMLRMLAALELLTAERKQQAGAWFLQRVKKVGSWWPLGRLGARELFCSDDAEVVPTATAEAWLGRVLALDWEKDDTAAFAAVLLARETGDPTRDVDDALRTQVIKRLRAAKARARWIAVVESHAALSDKDAGALLGDSLPAGLRLA